MKTNIPDLKDACETKDTNEVDCCDNCVYFSSEPFICPLGWCGLYPAHGPNTDVCKVCPKHRRKRS